MCPKCHYTGSMKENRDGYLYCTKCGWMPTQQMYFDFRE